MMPKKVPIGLVVGMLLLVLLTSGAAGFSLGYRIGANEPRPQPDPPRLETLGMNLQAGWFGDAWPFDAKEVYVWAYGPGAVVATIDGTDYALNGLAGNAGIPQPMPPISKARTDLPGSLTAHADWTTQREIGLELDSVRRAVNELLAKNVDHGADGQKGTP
jgi:hypothetical protein